MTFGFGRRLIVRAIVLVAYLLVPFSFSAFAEQSTKTEQRSIQLKDIAVWKSVRSTVVSSDGQWVAVLIAPNKGNGNVVLRHTSNKKTHTIPVGDSASSAGQFSPDGHWYAVPISPTTKEKEKLNKAKKTPHKKLMLIELTTGKKSEIDKVSGFQFSGEEGQWIALRKYSPASTTKSKDKATGSNLILRELATGQELNFGNIASFAFNKSGEWLAMVVDAQDHAGNGIQLFHVPTQSIRSVERGKANYKSLLWNKEGTGLTILKGVADKQFKDKLYSVVAFRSFAAGRSPSKVVFDPKEHKNFPKGMTVSSNQTPRWSEDLSMLSFGIHKLEKTKSTEKSTRKESGKQKANQGEKGKKSETGKTKDGTTKKAKKGNNRKRKKRAARRGNRRRNQKSKSKTTDSKGKEKTLGAKEKASKESLAKPKKAGLVIWHWKDKRLQSQQQKDASRDKRRSFLCVYHVQKKRFVRLADESLKSVSLAPKEQWAIGTDDTQYKLMASLDGKRYSDIYVLDVRSGKRKLALKKARWYNGPSPDGTHLLFFQRGHYHTYEILTGDVHNITKDVPTSFVNTEDDHNINQPPIRPIGWTKGGGSVLLYDNWDMWKVDRHGDAGLNLTVDGKEKGIRYSRRLRLDAEEKGIDLSKSVYISAQNEWTKESGFVRLSGGAPGPNRLIWDKAIFGGLQKAKKADVFVYTRQSDQDCANVFLTHKDFQHPKKLTDANPQQKKFLWSSGVRLVTYTNSDGVKLQGALFLPANYQNGKKYPTILYMYEKLSRTAYMYQTPSYRGFNRSIYTSNGYAVLMPDIVYKVNDPGLSSVDCLKAALKAGIATGVIDPNRVGIHGHSWGGYQTAFMITQSNAFKAAVAGAPLTNLISMYSSIYWNRGIANQPIFESSQGRFTGPYWQIPDAYMRNSPVYHAHKVTTPLLLLHNDKDGAVDWNQGIEYFNTLRRLRKPVIMLQYKGENHGVVKPENRRDYTVRMREFFDHHLKGRPAPEWMRQGITHLKLDEHLEKRAKAEAH
ncbi:MAG: prolyl oligopeptidase family serine peptidase [Gemmataceae bacterium]